jgi:hypothetical protein
MRISLPSSPAPSVQITSDLTSWEQHFSGSAAVLKPLSFVVTNNSDRPIMAIVTIWNVTDSRGKTRSLKLASDSYLLAELLPVLAAHGSALVLPFQVITDSDPRVGSDLKLERTIADFSDAVAVDVSLDSVIFQDGEVVGPNTSRMDENIRDRTQAATELVALLAQVKNRGESVPAFLREMKTGRAAVTDGTELWKGRFVQMLSSARDLDQQMRYLQKLSRHPVQFRHTKLSNQDGGNK